MTKPDFLSHLAAVHSLIWDHAHRLARTRRVSAEDLVQHATLTLWAERHKAAEHPAPAAWFAQAARWAMLRHAERESRHLAERLDSLDFTDTPGYLDAPPDEFDALVGLLEPAAGELVRRRFRDGCEFAELAADAGITADGVRYRLNVALDHLRGRLAG